MSNACICTPLVGAAIIGAPVAVPYLLAEACVVDLFDLNPPENDFGYRTLAILAWPVTLPGYIVCKSYKGLRYVCRTAVGRNDKQKARRTPR